jgi:AraC-like DNA-binding protein
MVRFHQYQPCSALAAYVKCYWTLEHNYVPDIPECIMPDGCIEMIFHYGDKYRSIINGYETDQPDNIVVGQITQAIHLQPTGKTGIFAIRFYPWGLYAFTSIPTHELTDRFEEAETILGKKLRYVNQQLKECSSAERLIIVEKFLLSLLSKQKRSVKEQADRIAVSLNRLKQTGGNTPVAEMAYFANLSLRQFNRTVNKVAGISPKQLSRITRLQNFLQKYQPSTGQTLTQVLYDCGYYDQAHFIREFKDISGKNPSQFFAQNNEMSDLMLL